MRVVVAHLILLLLLSVISHETSAQRWRVNRQMKKLEENFNNHSGLMIYVLLLKNGLLLLKMSSRKLYGIRFGILQMKGKAIIFTFN